MAMVLICMLIGVAMATPLDDDCVEPASIMNFLLQVETQKKFARGREGDLTNCGRLVEDKCDPTANFFCTATIAKYTHMGKIAIDQFQR